MMIEETLRAFAAAFEMGIRLAALILVVSIVGAAVIGGVIEGELTGSHAGIALLFVAALLVGVVLLWDTPFFVRPFPRRCGVSRFVANGAGGCPTAIGSRDAKRRGSPLQSDFGARPAQCCRMERFGRPLLGDTPLR